jgi:hypothetical protein
MDVILYVTSVYVNLIYSSSVSLNEIISYSCHSQAIVGVIVMDIIEPFCNECSMIK